MTQTLVPIRLRVGALAGMLAVLVFSPSASAIVSPTLDCPPLIFYDVNTVVCGCLEPQNVVGCIRWVASGGALLWALCYVTEFPWC